MGGCAGAEHHPFRAMKVQYSACLHYNSAAQLAVSNKKALKTVSCKISRDGTIHAMTWDWFKREPTADGQKDTRASF
jgi:hypothetical protein